MSTNGPAIEFVSVAERLETESMINLLEAGSVRGRKERSMAHFLPPGTIWFGVRRNRGTSCIVTSSESRCRSLVEGSCVAMAVKMLGDSIFSFERMFTESICGNPGLRHSSNMI